MLELKISKNILTMFIFMLLFSFTNLIIYISAANKIAIIAIVMILVPCLYMVYQINSNNGQLPRYIRLIGITSATLYLFYEFLNLVIYFFSFYFGEKSLYIIWEYRIILFGSMLGILLLLHIIKLNVIYLKQIIIFLFTASIVLLFNFMLNLALDNDAVIKLVSFDSNYTNIIAVSLPLLFLIFIKFDSLVMKESLTLAGAYYLGVVIMIMLASNFVSQDTTEVAFFNTAFGLFIKDSTGPVTANLLMIVFLFSECVKAIIIYFLAKNYYNKSNSDEIDYSLPISFTILLLMFLLILVFSNNLWTMQSLIETMYIGIGIIFLITIACYCIYLCFKQYMLPMVKGFLLILSTFPIIICIIYLKYINSPIFGEFNLIIQSLNAIFFMFSVLVLTFYLCETFILWYGYSKRIKSSSIDIPEAAEEINIFVMIPCMNEDLVINKTLTSILNNQYSNLYVYVIDDASTDNTLFEVANCRDRRKHVLKRIKPNAQQGKGEALNWAYYQLLKVINDKGLDHDQVLIAIIDADTEVESDYFSKVNKIFQANSAVTGLQSKVRVVELGYDSAQDLEFAEIINSMQSVRNLTNTVAFGGNGQFCRLSILEELNQKPWSDSLVEDFDLSTRLYIALGNKVKNVQYDDIYIKQSGIINDSASLVKQRVRWAQGNVQSFKYVKQIIMSRKLQLRQKIELCATLLKPWLMAIEYAILIYTLVLIADVYIFEGFTRALILVVVMFIVMGCFIIFINIIWSILYNKDKAEKFKITIVISDAYYLTKFLFALTQIYPQSILRHLKSENGWDKTKRRDVKQS